MALTWRKSSHSSAGSGNSGGDCVEVAFGSTGPLLRDGKTGDHGPVLHTNQAAFDALISTAKR